MQTYTLLDDGRAIRCLRCGLTSHNMNDVEQRYCPRCHAFHGQEGRPDVPDDLFATLLYAMDQSQPVLLHLSPMHAWVLFAQLQLALRHPQNIGPASQIARDIAQQLQQLIATNEPLRTLAAQGWHPTEDGL